MSINVPDIYQQNQNTKTTIPEMDFLYDLVIDCVLVHSHNLPKVFASLSNEQRRLFINTFAKAATP